MAKHLLGRCNFYRCIFRFDVSPAVVFGKSHSHAAWVVSEKGGKTNLTTKYRCWVISTGDRRERQ